MSVGYRASVELTHLLAGELGSAASQSCALMEEKSDEEKQISNESCRLKPRGRYMKPSTR